MHLHIVHDVIGILYSYTVSILDILLQIHVTFFSSDFFRFILSK